MIQNTQGIILRKREYGENDLLLTLLSDQGERLDCIVKGANRPSSRRRAHLEPMNWIGGSLYQGTQRLYLQNVAVKNSFIRLKENVDLVFRLAVLLEILDRNLQPKDPAPAVYHLLKDTLSSLNTAPHPFLTEVSLIKLADLLGFLPSFRQCGACHTVLQEAHWDAEAGMLSCGACRKDHQRPLPIKYCKAFEFFRSASTEDCRKVQLQTEEADLLRAWIPSFFSLHLDKPLKSLQVQVY